MQGVLAPALSVGAMGHLGTLGASQKLAGYNIVYSYCIQCDILLSLLSNDPKDPKAIFALWQRMGQACQNARLSHNPTNPTKTRKTKACYN
jgi:hypothetical protein